MALAALRGRAPQQLISLQSFRGLASAAPVRDPRFATLTDADLRVFTDILGPSGVVTDPHELQPFNRCAPPAPPPP